jgi:hypothetical protein
LVEEEKERQRAEVSVKGWELKVQKLGEGRELERDSGLLTQWERRWDLMRVQRRLRVMPLRGGVSARRVRERAMGSVSQPAQERKLQKGYLSEESLEHKLPRRRESMRQWRVKETRLTTIVGTSGEEAASSS